MIDGILEFTFRPVANKKPAITTFIILLAIGAAAATASVISPIYKGLISMAAVIALCSAVYIFVRYISSDYAYVVAYAGDIPMFLVTKTVGKRVTTLFNMPIYQVLKIESESAKERKERKTPAGTQRFNYNVTLLSWDGYRIYAKSRYGSKEILIEGTAELSERLMQYAALAREVELAEDDY